jgi:phenylpyruvate tautomerase PptA (4-oxalocrotonate tautomerase family)
MPFIDMQLSKKLDYAEKQKLQAVATDIVAQAMGKPAGAVMVSVHDACDLYMGGRC